MNLQLWHKLLSLLKEESLSFLKKPGNYSSTKGFRKYIRILLNVEYIRNLSECLQSVLKCLYQNLQKPVAMIMLAEDNDPKYLEGTRSPTSLVHTQKNVHPQRSHDMTALISSKILLFPEASDYEYCTLRSYSFEWQ